LNPGAEVAADSVVSADIAGGGQLGAMQRANRARFTALLPVRRGLAMTIKLLYDI